MTERLPDGTYEAKDIEQALGELPADLAWVVRDGLLRAQERRKEDREAQRVREDVASFAIALHIQSVDHEQQASYVNGINWHYELLSTAESVVRGVAKTNAVELPDSVRKAIAFTYAGERFLFMTEERDEIDAGLAKIGYSINKILDDMVDQAIEKGNASGKTREEIKAILDEDLESLDLTAVVTDFNGVVRQDLTAQGYRLPELLEDGGYGCDEKEGENRPYGTPDTIPR